MALQVLFVIRIVIAEDDPLMSRTLQHLCSKAFADDITSIKTFNALVPALYHIRENPIDLLLLDINLKGDSGFDILETPEKESFYTIIVSSDTQNAVNAFEYGVLDFIAKPFTEERFMAAIARMQKAGQASGVYRNSIPVKKDGAIDLVKYEDILYLQAVGNFTDIVLRNGSTERIRRTMESMVSELSSDFFRSHRSFIINLAAVNRIVRSKNNTYSVIMENQSEVAVSRSRYNLLRNLFSDSAARDDDVTEG